MRHYRFFLSILSMLIFFTPAAAFDLQKGMHGMQWASDITQYDHLTKVRESKKVAYYVNSNMIYQIGSQAVPDVFYGFYNDRFFAVFIKLRSPDQFYRTNRRFSARYGDPKVVHNSVSQQVIYRWKDADVKIKLKMRESIKEIKLAIYYSPISTKLNEERLEQEKLDVNGPCPSKEDKTVKSAPLLDF